MDGLTALKGANADFDRRLRLIRAGDWERPTPCTEWDVRALVNHVVGGNRRYLLLLHGASAEEVNRNRTADHLGEDAVASFVTTARELETAFREDGALDRLAHHPVGDRTGAQLLAMRELDVTVHAWDLARALDADDALDPRAVDFALAHVDVITIGRERGSFATSSDPAPAGASPQARLLHLAGRLPAKDQP